MTTPIALNHTRATQLSSRTRMDVSHSRSSVQVERGAVSASRMDFRASFQTDSFSGGGSRVSSQPEGIRAGGCPLCQRE